MPVAVVGLSHKTAPVEVREKLSIPEEKRVAAIQQLCSYPHIQEATVLCTCNRMEVYFVTGETHHGIREVTAFLSEHSGIPLPQLRPYLFTLLHQDAVMHLLRVAAGLDSLVLGEGQILAQVKHCHKLGQEAKGTGTVLNRLLRGALEAGKRVRAETGISSGAMSISSAAVELACLRVPHLSRARITVVGAGKMARLLVTHLVAKGIHRLTLVNRSLERATELASQFPETEIHLRPLEDLAKTIPESDVVFTSTASTEPLIHRALLQSWLLPQQSLMLFDISVPRNVSPDVNELPHVHTYNVDDLREVVSRNQERRRQMVLEAEAILEEELEAFDLWWQSLETVPTLNQLREKVEAIRTQELEKALSRLGADLSNKQREIVEALTKGIVNKILHDPMVQLRAQRDLMARRRALQALHTLFNLNPEESLSRS
ncbi:MAG: glutamyl-tRNA reductase [Gloeomargarita sp. GMQP_bins_120]